MSFEVPEHLRPIRDRGTRHSMAWTATPASRIYDGPDEVHRMTVARRILREHRNGNRWDLGMR